ncbi:SSPO-like protein [Mya arenaria]|uniref:SSPO-like protein n=1 Tax=Mya arenaria TaxID=6604 RepID=A0ABY7FMY1_MYAAR|nr:SSPO-like protein [Mya arenaria]
MEPKKKLTGAYILGHNLDSNSSFPGKRFLGHVIEEFSTKRQVIHCAYECLKSSRCASFNYEHVAGTCQVNDADHVTDPGGLEHEEKGTRSEYHLRNAFTIDECFVLFIPLKGNQIAWAEWEDWGPCSVTCEEGWTTRRRRCVDVVTLETLSPSQCYGRDVEYTSCSLQSCPRWEAWSEWGNCSTEHTCGRGVKHRHRNCSNGGVPGRDRWCLGFPKETAPCEGIHCRGMLVVTDSELHGDGRLEIQSDIDYTNMAVCADQGWGVTEVDIACRQIGFQGAGHGVENKTYTVSLLAPGAKVVELLCSGSESTIQQCTREPVYDCTMLAGIQCRIKGGWSLWSGWGECSVTCEDGMRTRTRDCNHPPPNYGGTPCPGDQSQQKPCTEIMCPRNGTWEEWGEWTTCQVTCGEGKRTRTLDGVWVTWSTWSECDVTCENGTRFRTRTCDGPFHDGAECPGADQEVEDCFPRMCPVDGVWRQWLAWSECSHTCGYGTRSRSRTCEGPFYDGAECPGVPDEVESCNAFSCPVDGSWKLWSTWGECSVTCGGGMRNRTRECDMPEFGGENCAGPADQSEGCSDFPCPIDCVFGEWIGWSACSVTCANGTRWRSRETFGPYFGGQDCTGATYDEEVCVTESCPVDGEWDTWGPWAECNVSCGGGVALRSRLCHEPLHGGDTCEGEAEEVMTCNEHTCAVDGVWQAWSNWTECTLTCGTGSKHRNRVCDGPYLGGNDCDGPVEEVKDCNTHLCPMDGVFSEWSEWSECSHSCGRGNTFRNRTCYGPYNGGAPCEGPAFETEYCNPASCPVHGVWNPWQVWSECSVTCANGTRERNRTCDGPFFGGDECNGDGTHVEECWLRWCPVDGVWLEWTEWDDCPVTCGGALQNRTRVCEGPFYDGLPCEGQADEAQDCNTLPCPVDGSWSLWSKWATCNVTCGGGTTARFRYCTEGIHGGSNCTDNAEEYKKCNTHECPIDGKWDSWAEWAACSLSCGAGERSRNRNCTGPFFGGADCEGLGNETEPCNTHACPVDGSWGSWRVWSACSKSCGTGRQLRVRTCEGVTSGGTDCKGDAQENRPCNAHDCPVDGIWETWASWGACNVTCGGGTRWRSRECDGPFHGGAECPGSNMSAEACNTHECPIDGVWEDWSVWDECSVTCGGGDQSRYRVCDGPLYGGANCSGPEVDTRDCNTHHCPIDGKLTEWSQFYACDLSCGDGIQWRNRTCEGPFYGGANCTEPLEDFRECNTHNCPIDGMYGPWSSWEECSLTCGKGITWRKRTCYGPFYGGAECEEPSRDNQTCNDFHCPVDGVWEEWSDWDACSVSCGGSMHARYRNCTGPFYEGAECAGPEQETENCNMHECPVDGVFSEWSAWLECDVTCGGGIQWKTRSCVGPFHGGANCAGPYEESQHCNTHECPIDGKWQAWASWQECSTTCGGGERIRTRVCDGPFHGGAECPDSDTDTEVCGTALCPIPGLWNAWSPWSLCTVTCGGGIRNRNRTCDADSFGELTAPCEGSEDEEDICHTFECLPLAIHCADWASRGLNQSCIADVDPDGEESVYGPVQVECDFDTDPGKAVTVIHHDQENRTQVKGYEGAGEYQAILIYDIGYDEAIQIISSSEECAQFMRWDCLAAIIHNPFNPDMLTTFWMNRTEQMANYFGGATPGSGNCACGETNSCFNSSLPCNCDENDDVWRYDEVMSFYINCRANYIPSGPTHEALYDPYVFRYTRHIWTLTAVGVNHGFDG